MAEGVVLGIISLVLAAILKGESLKGLSHLGSITSLAKSSVPLWWMAIAVLVATIASSGWMWKRLSRGRSIPGLVHFRPRFNGYDYEPSMDSADLLMVFNDGKSWIPNHREALERRVLVRGQKVRVLLIHPRSTFLSTLVKKADRSIAEETTYLYKTFRLLEELRAKRPELVEIRGHHLFNPYILHLTESMAIVHPFFLLERGELPLLLLRKTDESGLYDQYRDDAEKVWKDALTLREEDFPLADKSAFGLPTATSGKRLRKGTPTT